MKAMQSLRGLMGIFFLGICASLPAYPEYQAFIVKESGRPVNCGMCHTNADGPNGTGFGQIGRLSQGDLMQLTQARAALQPGSTVNSPILNAFGNRIVHELGREKIIELKHQPAKLAELLKPDVDLDHDGIPDYQEYLEGTHPLKKSDGNPWKLFKINFQRNIAHIVLTAVATAAGLYGLIHLLHGFTQMARTRSSAGEVSEGASKDDES